MKVSGIKSSPVDSEEPQGGSDARLNQEECGTSQIPWGSCETNADRKGAAVRATTKGCTLKRGLPESRQRAAHERALSRNNSANPRTIVAQGA